MPLMGARNSCSRIQSRWRRAEEREGAGGPRLDGSKLALMRLALALRRLGTLPYPSSCVHELNQSNLKLERTHCRLMIGSRSEAAPSGISPMASRAAGARASGPASDVADHSIRKVAMKARAELEQGATKQGQCADEKLKECDECPGCQHRQLETDDASW